MDPGEGSTHSKESQWEEIPGHLIVRVPKPKPNSHQCNWNDHICSHNKLYINELKSIIQFFEWQIGLQRRIHLFAVSNIHVLL